MKSLPRLRCARGFAALLVFLSGAALRQAHGVGNAAATATTSTSSFTTTTTSTLDQRTRTGTVQKIIAGGDQVNTVGNGGRSLSDPRVQAALHAALAALRAQLPPFPQGASLQLLSRTPGSGGTSSTTTQNFGSTMSIQSELAVGPTTIVVGNRDTGGTPFSVVTGSFNVNTNTLTENRINLLTTLTGGAPTLETFLQQRIITLDLGAVFSLLESGVPVALVQREALLAVEQVAGRDVGGRLFRLRAESSPETASAGGGGAHGTAGPAGKEGKAVELQPPGWRAFATGDFGLADQEQSAAHAGFGSATLAGTVGVERSVAPGLTLGLAGTWLENRTELSNGLGRLNLDGYALAAYASYVRAPFYADVLYRFGDYEDEVHRNTLQGATARATPHARHHTVQFHTGWNFRAGPVVTGPLAAVSYTHGALDGYTETGAGAQDTRVAGQGYDSLRTELGWQASQRVPVSFGAVTWQLRASWQRENLDGRDSVRVGLVDSPFFATGGNGQQRRFGKFALDGQTAAPGDDWLALGGGLQFEVGERTSVLLDYEGTIARDNRIEHVGALRVALSF